MPEWRGEATGFRFLKQQLLRLSFERAAEPGCYCVCAAGLATSEGQGDITWPEDASKFKRRTRDRCDRWKESTTSTSYILQNKQE